MTIGAVLMLMPIVGMSTASATEWAVPLNEHVAQVAGTYWSAHQGDYVGWAAAIEAAGGDTVRITFPDAGLSNLTGAEAQAAVDAATFAAGNTTDGAAALIESVPVNAFQVAAAWYHVRDTDGEWWNFAGTWNFRDNYVGTGAPDNGSGLSVTNMSSTCWRQDGDWMSVASYDGIDYSGLAYRKDVTFNSSVWAVRDTTSSHKMLSDHGSHYMSWKRIKSGCSFERPYGRYYHEHNQGGHGGWGFSISVKVFSLSYTGSGGDTLQKSSGLTYRPEPPDSSVYFQPTVAADL